MKLSEYKNEEAIEKLADLLEPACDIFADEELVKLIRNGDKIKSISYALKNHSSKVLEILAIMDNIPVEQYECNIMTLPAKILEIFNDADLMGFFLSQLPKEGKNSSGNATEGTTGVEITEDLSNSSLPVTSEMSSTEVTNTI